MIGTAELIVIFLVVLLLFGGKRLPELAKSLGAGIREFKRACHGTECDDTPAPKKALPTDEAKDETSAPSS